MSPLSSPSVTSHSDYNDRVPSGVVGRGIVTAAVENILQYTSVFLPTRTHYTVLQSRVRKGINNCC